MQSIPDKIGKYEVIRELGRGATSAVYLARDTFTRLELAIKLAFADALRDPVHGARHKKQFFNEAFLAGTLRHPHIVTLLDAVVDERYSYIVMEYVPGGTLKQFCEGGNLLPPEKVVEIIFKCSRALGYASRQGVIHRDIKPANILVERGTDIKVSDFGAALLAHSDHTQITGMIGSPAYMSPEQVKEQRLTFHSDMFSLGAVMYELLTGRKAFPGDNGFSIAYKIANEDPPPLRVVRPDLPAGLESMVARALQKRVADRYESWEEFSLALRDALKSVGRPKRAVADTEKFAVLKQLDFFREFTDAELWEVVRLSSWKKFRAGTTLLKENRIGQSFYILGGGGVRVTKAGRVIGRLGAGACFGELAYLNQRPTRRSAGVIAETDVMLIKIKATALSEASQNCQLRFNRILTQTLIDRLNTGNRRLAAV